MTAPETTPPPLSREGSRVCMVIAATVLLVGGLAGMAGGAEPHHATAAVDHGAAPAASAEADDHAHTAPAAELATGHDQATHAHDAAAGEATAVDHGHAAGGAVAASTGAGHATHVTDVAPDDAHAGHGTGPSHGDTAGGGTGHGDGGHADHGDDMAAGDHHHATSCADDHPVSKALVTEVQGELATTYKDIAALVALGYHPYFDSLIPGGYPPGGEGISHWINPNYIDDGVVLDPKMPETILLDNWNWPIGMMFINDPGVPPKPVYVNDDGKACSPWHPHTDYPARFGWYYYRAMYDREMEGEVPAQTPEMMHVWAIGNPKGVYAAHDYPPTAERKGAPGPIPSYFSETTVPGS